MSNLKIELSGGNAKLSGFIDETSALGALKSVEGPLSVNFSGITRVNSCGIREWVDALAQFPSKEVTYLECPAVVVKQLNAVPDFLGRAKIGSFYAPYFCEPCDKEESVLIQAESFQGKAPDFNCPSCSKPMNLDAIPAQYFAFLARKPE